MTEEQLGKLRAIYENIPDRDTFIHGDCHIGNVMQQNGELMFIDLSSSGSGHPIFDLMSMYSLFVERGNDPEAMAKSAVLRHFTSEEAHDIWWTFISTYLNTEDDALIRKAERHICAVAFARRLFMLVVMPGVLSAEKTEIMIRTLMDYYDAGLETIDLGI
jgi:thiamine kinase-like enzyme